IDITGENTRVFIGDGNATVDLGHGTNEVHAGSGIDQINLDQGQNVVYGGSGRANIAFHKNDGLLSVYETVAPSQAGGNDTISFGAGLHSDALVLSSHGSNPDLTIGFNDSNDVIVLSTELDRNAPKVVDTFSFAGDVLTMDELLSN